MRVDCNIGTVRHPHFTFRTNGPVRFHGRSPNPSKDLPSSLWSARLFIGLSQQARGRRKARKHTVAAVVKIVKSVRTNQGIDPDSSFISQRGLYTNRDQDIISEKSVQVVILSIFGEKVKEFQANIIEVAEVLAQKLGQDEVIVEFQRSGVSKRFVSVTT